MFEILIAQATATPETTNNIIIGIIAAIGAALAGSGITIKILRNGNVKTSKSKTQPDLLDNSELFVSKEMCYVKSTNLEKELKEQREDIKGIHKRIDNLVTAQNNSTNQIISAIDKIANK